MSALLRTERRRSTAELHHKCSQQLHQPVLRRTVYLVRLYSSALLLTGFTSRASLSGELTAMLFIRSRRDLCYFPSGAAADVRNSRLNLEMKFHKFHSCLSEFHNLWDPYTWILASL